MSAPSRASVGLPPRTRSSWIPIVMAGVAAAMHIWKVPEALEFIQRDLGMTLIESGVLLGIVQVGSMLLGLAVSLFSEVIGLRRTLLVGLSLLTLGSLSGAFAETTGVLMATRALEGVGFLMATVVAPPLIRVTTQPARVNIAMGWWGGFQGLATFLAVLASTLLLTAVSWQAWWIAMAVVTAGTIPLVVLFVSPPPAAHGADLRGALRRVGATVRTPTPWIAGLVFACYTLQWGSVIGFLPTIFDEAGVGGLWPGIVTAVVGGLNGVGNILTGRLHQRGVPMRPLILTGLVAMGVTSVITFAPDWSAVPGGLAVQVLAVGLFSGVGALIPASLNRIAVDIAPADGSPAAVMGLMVQIYNGANFVGPIIIAAIATAAGGWHLSWTMTGAAALLGALLAGRFLSARRLGLDFRHRG
ncbi:MFS transporter [Citricoccus sp. SGAir0253]|uniref:MFS transporter n=1 Tax=Citricoccus sp. SGAir0253 TaxID=2567881 RepID=UPI0010CCB432|nr:MFS transporter [Citricoccus sp. SGAir0253]QCU78920.1 MFS transporter [Citricoccus sp. SGAir0253]